MKCKISKHIYAHIDCDSFFASCEVLRRPELHWKYVCVWGEIIIAATYNAKKLGVKCGTPIWEAKKILKGKQAYFCWVDIPYYTKVSQKIMDFLKDNTLDVRKFSIDEAFVEITWLPEMHKISLQDFLQKLQQDILKNIWVPVSIWVSNTRLKAKIFSKVNKPFWNYIWLENKKERNIFQELSYREIPFIGRQTAKKLDHELQYISDYIALWYFETLRRFWKNGAKIWLELSGVESMSFLPKKQAKSIGRARGFNREMTSNTKILLKKLQYNLQRLLWELFEKNMHLASIEILLIDSDWKHYSMRKDLVDYSSDEIFIFSEIEKLFSRIYIPWKLYRKTWVFSRNIQSRENRQLSIFGRENINNNSSEKLEKVLQSVRMKYGEESIRVGEAHDDNVNLKDILIFSRALD